MFKRGNWAVLGLEQKSLVTFKQNLLDKKRLLEVSQVAALVTTKLHQTDSLGINPFASPRFDETLHWPEAKAALDPNNDWANSADAGLVNMIDAHMQSSKEDRATNILETDLFEQIACLEETKFHIEDEQFGFWAVLNAWYDVCDLNSKKEDIAYQTHSMPYSFLSSDVKRTIDVRVAAETVVKRTQFPVLINFLTGRVFMQTTNKKQIEAVQELLTNLGLEIRSVRWEFGSSNWLKDFLSRVEKTTAYKPEFQKRAEEHTRFEDHQIEKLEDAAMEKVVANFFAIAELPTGQWAALGTPAQIKLHKASDPISITAPHNATTLLDISDESAPASAVVTIQDYISKIGRNNEEKFYRKDIMRLELNDGSINIQEVGAAILKGFDLPDSKKDILRCIRKDKQTFDISYFWCQWASALQDGILTFTDNVVETLELERGSWGIQFYDEEDTATHEVV